MPFKASGAENKPGTSATAEVQAVKACPLVGQAAGAVEEAGEAVEHLEAAAEVAGGNKAKPYMTETPAFTV